MALGTQITRPVAVLVLAAAAVSAQEAGLQVSTLPGQQARGAKLGAPELRLSLQDAVSMALEHNINLEVSRLGLASAGEGVIAATGVFDPYARVNFSEQFSTSPATNQLVGAQVNEVKRRVFDISYGQTFATGGFLGLSWDNTRTETNSSFYFLNPSYDSGLGLQITQPLLQGFGTDVNRAQIEVARRNRDISGLQFAKIVIATMQGVEDAYWNLVYQIDNLKVKQRSLQLAQDLLEQTQTRVRIGTSAPIDIVQSEATVAAREQDIIVAENAVQGAADTLKLLLGFEDPEDWKSQIIPTDTLETATVTPGLDEAIEESLKRRVELRQRELEREIREISLLAADNAVLPALDLSVGYGYSGVGGTYTQRDPETGEIIAVVPGGWDDAMQQIGDRDYNQWSAGLAFTYTIGNNTARAVRAQRRYDLSIAKQTMAAERQSVIEETRRAVRGLADSAKSIAAAEKARVLAERNLDAEQKKFANGMSTNYQVLLIQEDLAVAQAAELLSRVAYRRSAVAYEVAVGKLLESRGVALRQGAEAEEPHRFLSGVEWLQYGKWAGDVSGEAEPAK